MSNSEIIWHRVTDSATLERLVDESMSRPVVIFKHSTRCGISRMVLRQFESRGANTNTSYYFLDLLENRAVSNEVAERFGVVHQSPQVLVIEKGRCTHTASHYDILEMTAGRSPSQ